MLAYALRAFCLEPFQIPSGSMIPTLLVGDHLFVSKSAYGIVKPFGAEPGYWYRWSEPKPGDVVVFEAPPYVGPNHGEAWIKRVVAGPGQTVFMRDSVLHVDGKPYEHAKNLVRPPIKIILDDETMDARICRAHRVEAVGNIQHSIFLSEPPKKIGRHWFGQPTLQLPGLGCGAEACKVAPGHIFCHETIVTTPVMVVAGVLSQSKC